MYCTVDDVKLYLGGIPSTDDTLLSVLVNAAHQRINDDTRRNFEATADTLHYLDAREFVHGPMLELDSDLSYISSVTIDGAALPTTEYVTDPRNSTPWEALRMRSNSSYAWSYSTDPEDAIAVTGRWAVMHSKPITAISRATNVITATMSDTSGLSIGATVYCAGVADASFNGGAFTLTAVTATTATWAQTGTNDTDTTGTLLFTPASIRQACTRLASFLYRQKDTQGGVQEQPILAGDGSVIMPTTLPRDVQILLQPWVKIR
jgi:hypothetical protein